MLNAEPLIIDFTFWNLANYFVKHICLGVIRGIVLGNFRTELFHDSVAELAPGLGVLLIIGDMFRGRHLLLLLDGDFSSDLESIRSL